MANSAISGALPRAREERCVEEALYRLRFTVPKEDVAGRISSLIVETRHPKFSEGQCPAFSLTQLLERAYELSPATVAQIVAPDTHEEIRREAIKDLLRGIGIKSALAGVAQVPIARFGQAEPRDELDDELEPRFTIQTQCATAFHDFLAGHCRKEVTVLRNDQAVVRFSVVEAKHHLVDAEIQAVPIEVSWPILGRDGNPVTLDTVDDAILDFSSLLFAKRAASWGLALQAVAEELERRQFERNAGYDDIPRENFLFGLLAAAPEDQLRSTRLPSTAVSLALAPEGRDLLPHDLGDNRVVWLGIERAGPGVPEPRLIFAGFSLAGSEYRVEIVASAGAERRLCSIHRELAKANDPERFFSLLDRALQLPGAQALCHAGAEIDHYPDSINSVASALERSKGCLRVSRGGWPEKFSLFDPLARLRVVALLRGLSPLKAEQVGPSPAHSWRFECALDELLCGSVFARNGLGETLRVSIGKDGSSLESRSEFLRHLLALGAAYSAELRRAASATAGVSSHFDSPVSNRILPALDSIALQWQQELIRSGLLKEFSCAGKIPWWVESLSRGRCTLSILPVRGEHFWWPANHALIVGAQGIEVAYVSVGERSLLGGLRGSCFLPPEGQGTFSPAEQEGILRVLASLEGALSQDAAEKLILSELPDAVMRRRVLMRQQDPARHQQDLVQIARDWISRIFGLD